MGEGERDSGLPSLKTVPLIADVTVNPEVNSHTLVGLESRTSYEVQIAGFTRTGVGVRSEARTFTTGKHGCTPSPRHRNADFIGVFKLILFP